MKKFVICLAALFTCSLFTAEQPSKKPKPNEPQPTLQQPDAPLTSIDQFLGLPRELQRKILYGSASTFQEAIDSVHAMIQVNSFWRTVINNPGEVATMIDVLARQFNTPIVLSALHIGTPAAQQWLDTWLAQTQYKNIMLEHSLQEELSMYTGSNESKKVIEEIVKRYKPGRFGTILGRADGSLQFIENKNNGIALSTINYMGAHYTTDQLELPSGIVNPVAHQLIACKNGDLIVLVSAENNFFALRYTPNAKLDTTFANKGSFKFDQQIDSEIYSLLELSDDMLVAVGKSKQHRKPIIFKLSASGVVRTFKLFGECPHNTGFNKVAPGGTNKIIVLGASTIANAQGNYYLIVDQLNDTLNAAPNTQQWQSQFRFAIIPRFICARPDGTITVALEHIPAQLTYFNVIRHNAQTGNILNTLAIQMPE